jgi:hypothetical protein
MRGRIVGSARRCYQSIYRGVSRGIIGVCDLRPERRGSVRFQCAATMQAPEEYSKLLTLRRSTEYASEPFNVVRTECGDLIGFPTIVRLDV